MHLIAITGGIGCGKSTACRYLCEYGGFPYFFSADTVCHELYSSPTLEFRDTILRWCGDSVMKPDGGIDRIAVRNQLFAYPNVKRMLQNLNRQLNPIIWKVLNEDINRMITNEDEIVLVEVPLLFEAQWHKLFEYTVAVWAPRGIQYERLMGRTNNNKKLVDIMLSAQMSADLKLAKADFGLINTKNHAHLIRQCIVLSQGLQELIYD